jgi:hypothetical protein
MSMLKRVSVVRKTMFENDLLGVRKSSHGGIPKAKRQETLDQFATVALTHGELEYSDLCAD